MKKENEVKFIFYKILKIIDELHSNNYCLLGLDPAQIMFNEEYNPIIVNLGKMRKIELGKMLSKYEGKKDEFTPPELFKNQEYDGFKVDVFSLGIILYILLFKRKPFSFPIIKCDMFKLINEGSGEDKSKKFWKGKDFVDNIKSGEDFKSLFIKMVSDDFNKRFSIKEVINSKWLEKTKELFEEKNIKKLDKIDLNIINKFNNMKKKIEEVIIFSKEEIGGDEKKTQLKETQILYQKIPEKGIDDINKNNSIIIKNLTKPKDLIKNLVNYYKKNKTQEPEVIKYSEGEWEFTVTEKDKMNIKENKYSTGLYKSKTGSKYFVQFNYISGDLSYFYDGIKFTRNYLKLLAK